jgi:hypothetical protein
MKRFAIAFGLILFSLCSFAQSNKITAKQAKDHVGETATVCGKMVSTHFASSTKGQPTFLNLDQPYPREIFTTLIWGSDRSKFGNPKSKFRDALICVTGKISSYRGIPEVIVTDPAQIQVQK